MTYILDNVDTLKHINVRGCGDCGFYFGERAFSFIHNILPYGVV